MPASASACFSSPQAPIAQARVDRGSIDTAFTIHDSQPVPQRASAPCNRPNLPVDSALHVE